MPLVEKPPDLHIEQINDRRIERSVQEITRRQRRRSLRDNKQIANVYAFLDNLTFVTDSMTCLLTRLTMSRWLELWVSLNDINYYNLQTLQTQYAGIYKMLKYIEQLKQISISLIIHVGKIWKDRKKKTTNL